MQIQKFEKSNPNISVFAHAFGDKGPECIYKTSFSGRRDTVHLLCHMHHWIPITNLSAFYRQDRNKFYKCVKCLKSYFHPQQYEQHIAKCTGINQVQNERIPEPALCSFRDHEKTIDVPTVMYADIEAILEHLQPQEGSNTQRTQKHKPCAIGNMIISRIPNNRYHGKYVEHVGENCMSEFITYLEELAFQVWSWAENFETRIKAERTKEDEFQFNLQHRCYLCNRPFESKDGKVFEKHFDHDHLTGLFRGAACSRCNMNMRLTRLSVPIYFHNYRGYDNHHIVHAFNGRKDWVLEPIAQNMEKFMSMTARFAVTSSNSDGKKQTYISMCFRDSFQVLPEGLASLVANVGEESLHHTLEMSHIYGISKELILAKGIFPYSFFDSFDKMSYDHLPSKEDFYDNLSDKDISQADYERAQHAWREFQCDNMGDYMLRYLEMDVRQLADVFERFRVISRREDGLDGAHYMTVSQFAMSSALKLINKPIGLCHTPELYRLFEKSIRGGIAFCNTHFVEAQTTPTQCFHHVC